MSTDPNFSQKLRDAAEISIRLDPSPVARQRAQRRQKRNRVVGSVAGVGTTGLTAAVIWALVGVGGTTNSSPPVQPAAPVTSSTATASATATSPKPSASAPTSNTTIYISPSPSGGFTGTQKPQTTPPGQELTALKKLEIGFSIFPDTLSEDWTSEGSQILASLTTYEKANTYHTQLLPRECAGPGLGFPALATEGFLLPSGASRWESRALYAMQDAEQATFTYDLLTNSLRDCPPEVGRKRETAESTLGDQAFSFISSHENVPGADGGSAMDSQYLIVRHGRFIWVAGVQDTALKPTTDLKVFATDYQAAAIIFAKNQ